MLRGRRETTHATYIWRTYRLTAEQYWAIYEAQGRRCALCQRATGKTKRLAVDHDHRCCPETPTCGKCTRGLLCTTCNKRVLGHLRDDPGAFVRGALYVLHPPAEEILRGEALRDGAA